MIHLTKRQRRNLLALADELESGRKKQVRDTLMARMRRSPKMGYCCLGVACILRKVPHERARWPLAPEYRTQHEFHFPGHHGVVSVPPHHWWKEHYGALITGDEMADMNDNEKLSFRQIATVIRMMVTLNDEFNQHEQSQDW